MLVSLADRPHLSSFALADGAFDPLHAGHIAYLKEAKRVAGGPLLVTIASDDDIRAKGREPLLPAAQRAAVIEALACVDYVLIKDQPTECLLEALRPTAYIKGADWRGKIPPEQADVCARYDIPILYTDTPQDSSSARLSAWSVATADRELDRLEAYMAAQAVTPPETFDAEYFRADWRGANIYTLSKRREIEGKHPAILKETFPGWSMLDVGCGPGYLVQFLRELGVDAGGIDPSAHAVAMAPYGQRRVVQGQASMLPPKVADLAICREVLEHLTVAQVGAMVGHLFRVARKGVYITTRFHSSPRSVFDVQTEFEVDPTHITLMTQPMLRALCVLCGGKRRRDWENRLDWQGKGRVLAYEV